MRHIWLASAGQAPCGDNSRYSPRRQASILARASASDKNQWLFRHSSRSRPLKLSTKALSVGLPGRDKSSVTSFSYAHRSSAFEMNSGPSSTRMVLGAPRTDAIRATAATTCSPFMPWSTSIASAPRVKASTTVSARNRHPSNSASRTKSIDHISLAAETAGWRSRLAALTLQRGRLSRRLNPSSRYSRYNFARRLKALSGLIPYEYIAKIWTSAPDRLILNPIHQMTGVNT